METIICSKIGDRVTKIVDIRVEIGSNRIGVGYVTVGSEREAWSVLKEIDGETIGKNVVSAKIFKQKSEEIGIICGPEDFIISGQESLAGFGANSTYFNPRGYSQQFNTQGGIKNGVNTQLAQYRMIDNYQPTMNTPFLPAQSFAPMQTTQTPYYFQKNVPDSFNQTGRVMQGMPKAPVLAPGVLPAKAPDALKSSLKEVSYPSKGSEEKPKKKSRKHRHHHHHHRHHHHKKRHDSYSSDYSSSSPSSSSTSSSSSSDSEPRKKRRSHSSSRK